MSASMMTYRAKGWLLASVLSLAVWALVVVAAHDALSLWDEQQEYAIDPPEDETV